MTKREVLEKAQQYYQTVKNTNNSFKTENKKTPGHFTFNVRSNIPLCITLFLIGFASLGAVLTFVYQIPAFIAIPSSIFLGTFLGLGLPNLTHFLRTKMKSKKSRGYAKMELDSYFKVMQNFYSKYYKQILKANNENDVTKEDLQDFIDQAYTFANNYKNDLNKLIGKKIANRNAKDYKNIAKLNSKINSMNNAQITKKIEKILEKNNKFIQPWCDLYNNCGKVAKNMFLKTKEMNDKYDMPKDNEFKADACYLNKKVAKDFNLQLKSTSTCRNLTTFDMDLDDVQDNQLNRTIVNNLQERQKLNDEVFSK